MEVLVDHVDLEALEAPGAFLVGLMTLVVVLEVQVAHSILLVDY